MNSNNKKIRGGGCYKCIFQPVTFVNVFGIYLQVMVTIYQCYFKT